MKARGRPRSVEAPSVNVHFRLPAKQYDLTQRQADQARLPLADWLRRVVTHACRDPGSAKPVRR